MNDPYQRTDEELVEDYLAGDTGAFRVLIERYHDALLRFLLRLMGSRQAAEDVFQETFLQVHQSLDSFDTSRRLKPWLFTVAANKGRDELRRMQRRSTVSLSTPVGEGDGRGSLVDLMEIEMPAPSLGMETEEQSRMVQRAIDALPPRLREILLLAYFQKMTYAQIADAFEIPLGTVKSRLHAAVAAFAREWSRLVEEQTDQRRAKDSGTGE